MAAKRTKRKPKRRAGVAKRNASTGRKRRRSKTNKLRKRISAGTNAGKRPKKTASSPRFIPIVSQSVPSRASRDKGGARNTKADTKRKDAPQQRIRQSPDDDNAAPIDYDDEDLEEYAALWGVTEEEAEDVLEESVDAFANVPLDDYGRPDADYMANLSEDFDIDISDLYDLYYGYVPGSSE